VTIFVASCKTEGAKPKTGHVIALLAWCTNAEPFLVSRVALPSILRHQGSLRLCWQACSVEGTAQHGCSRYSDSVPTNDGLTSYAETKTTHHQLICGEDPPHVVIREWHYGPQWLRVDEFTWSDTFAV